MSVVRTNAMKTSIDKVSNLAIIFMRLVLCIVLLEEYAWL